MAGTDDRNMSFRRLLGLNQKLPTKRYCLKIKSDALLVARSSLWRSSW